MMMYVTYIAAETDPAEFKCTAESPVGPPVWSTNDPPVELRHIFCGEIKDNAAKGFHSESSATDHDECARSGEKACDYYDDFNGYCKNVFILDENNGYWELKSSTMWPKLLTPAELVPMFQELYNKCPPVGYNLCFEDCYWKGLAKHPFDIVIVLTRDMYILSAYPAEKGFCNKNPSWQDCGSEHCKDLLP